MESIIILLWVFATFAWSAYDINLRIERNDIKWYYVFTFFFNFIFMPVLAFIEKLYDTDDYVDGFRSWWRNIRNSKE